MWEDKGFIVSPLSKFGSPWSRLWDSVHCSEYLIWGTLGINSRGKALGKTMFPVWFCWDLIQVIGQMARRKVDSRQGHILSCRGEAFAWLSTRTGEWRGIASWQSLMNNATWTRVNTVDLSLGTCDPPRTQEHTWLIGSCCKAISSLDFPVYQEGLPVSKELWEFLPSFPWCMKQLGHNLEWAPQQNCILSPLLHPVRPFFSVLSAQGPWQASTLGCSLFHWLCK